MANFCVLGAFLLAFIVGEAAARDCGACPVGWSAFKDYCYKLSGNKENYGEAKAKCAAMGAQITAPHDAEELQFASSINPYVWIGCNDIETEGKFNCCDGTPNTYTLWGKGEPNDDQGNGGEDCGTLTVNNTYNDINCSMRDAEAICKKHVSCFV